MEPIATTSAAAATVADPGDAAFGAEAIARLKRGDSTALAECFRAHGPRVWRIARTLLGQGADADDALQEIFLKVRAKAALFDGRGAFGGWLRRLAVNHCLNLLAQRRRETARRDDVAPERLGLETAPALDVHDALEHELERLPRDQRAVIVLRELAGASYREIADELAIPIGTVMSRLARARERLMAGAKHEGAGDG